MLSPTRIVFMGTPLFAEPILDTLLSNTKYTIVAVYVRPDKPIGRKQIIKESPVKKKAQDHNIPVEQPEKFDDATLETLKSYKPDIVVVVAYGKILPKSVLEVPAFGCINIHPSLLPELRGPSPIQNALLLGKTQTGTTIMLMDEGMDSGDILAQKIIPIENAVLFPELSQTLATQSAMLLIETLPLWLSKQLTPTKQDTGKVTLCQLIEREDGHLLWNNDAETLFHTYQALTPWPGVYGFWNREKEELLRIKFLTISFQKENTSKETHHFGEVFLLGEKVALQTQQGLLFPEEVQIEGKKQVSITEFIKGYPQFVGGILQ
jgi:methionyl-tRNA formyltransferase